MVDEYDNDTVAASEQNQAEWLLLKSVVNAMLESLTREQQTKMARFLLQTGPQQNPRPTETGASPTVLEA